MPKIKLQSFDKSLFRKNLLNWYEKYKRDLPWRHTNNPYYIWISEIMLQQTKVETVIPYYEKFIEKYPTIAEFAEASEQDVLKMWEGLGYYSRARNLHSAVKEVVSTYNGKVPKDEKELGDLRGIGPYTKGAILSIAFNQAIPAVDGNVMRVLSRVFCIKDNVLEQKTNRLMESLVTELISDKKPGDFNQALMEIGATVCKPRNPICIECPLKTHCCAFKNSVTDQLPVRKKKTKQKSLEYYVLIIKDDRGNIAIEQRPNEGLLANMWQFPMVLKEDILINHRVLVSDDVSYQLNEKLGEVTHVFSHLIWHLHMYEASVSHLEKLKARFISLEDIKQYPFSTSHKKVMTYL